MPAPGPQPPFYRRSDLRSIFLMVVFPLHAWGIYWVLRNGEKIVERFSVSHMVAVTSYSQSLILLESALVFGAVLLLGLLLPRRWQPQKRAAVINAVYLAAALWAIAGNVYWLRYNEAQQETSRILALIAPHETPFFIFLLAWILLSVLLPFWLAARVERFTGWMEVLAERIGLLSILYLLIDAAALLVIAARWVGEL